MIKRSEYTRRHVYRSPFSFDATPNRAAQGTVLPYLPILLLFESLCAEELLSTCSVLIKKSAVQGKRRHDERSRVRRKKELGLRGTQNAQRGIVQQVNSAVGSYAQHYKRNSTKVNMESLSQV